MIPISFLVAIILAAFKHSLASEGCEEFHSCPDCVNARYNSHLGSQDLLTGHSRGPNCKWCQTSRTCFDAVADAATAVTCWDATKMIHGDVIQFQGDCPLGPDPYPHDIPFLPNWMQQFRLAGLLEDVRLMDLCLPGTHDSLSYDLSLTVSEDGLDDVHQLADLLHKLSGGTVNILPGELEDFFRMQAKTQQLTVSQQLDNGIRFLDLRIMLEPESGEWYSIHFMQSKHNVQYYWREIRCWMNEHPEEIVVIWLSKHRNTQATGNDQYPNVEPSQKLAIWQEFVHIFGDLLLDSSASNVFVDSVQTLISRQHRLIAFVCDYVEFTNSSDLALDAARIQNRYDNGPGVFDEKTTLGNHINYFRNSTANNAAINANAGFTLMGMNTRGDTWQIVAAAERLFLGWKHDLYRPCVHHFVMPHPPPFWCPDTLLDIVQLTSYYNQVAFEFATSNTNAGFPNAFYMDGLDVNGTIRIGPVLMDGAARGENLTTSTSKYGYVDSVLQYNLLKSCGENISENSGCDVMSQLISRRRALYGAVRWDQRDFGRLADWPSHIR